MGRGGAAISNPLGRFNWFVFRMLLYFAYRVKHETKLFTSICTTGGMLSILHTSFSMFLNKKNKQNQARRSCVNIWCCY